MYPPKPDAKQLHTLNELRNSLPFNTFLQDWKMNLVELLVATNDTELIGRLQGSIRVLDELMKQVQTAPETIARRTR